MEMREAGEDHSRVVKEEQGDEQYCTVRRVRTLSNANAEQRKRIFTDAHKITTSYDQ